MRRGTIYPDIIESGTKTVKAVKSHHNVGGLPEDLDFQLVEPLKMLFKDEVRACGVALGCRITWFTASRSRVLVLGCVVWVRLPVTVQAVRESDAILQGRICKSRSEGQVWQYFTAIPDFKCGGCLR